MKCLKTKKNIMIPAGTQFNTLTDCTMDMTYYKELELSPGVVVCIVMDEEAFSELNLMQPQPAVW